MEEMKINPPAFYDVPKASEVLNVTPKVIREMCKRGDFKGARKAGKEWRIPIATILPDREEVLT